jgi:hypothetical protein
MTRHEARLEMIQGQECSVCGQIVHANGVSSANLGRLTLRLKAERFSLCPSWSQAVEPELQGEKSLPKSLVNIREATAGPLRPSGDLISGNIVSYVRLHFFRSPPVSA